MLHNLFSAYILLMLLDIGIMIRHIKRKHYLTLDGIEVCGFSMVFCGLVILSPFVSDTRMFLATAIYGGTLIINAVHLQGKDFMYHMPFNVLSVAVWQRTVDYHATARKIFSVSLLISVMLALVMVLREKKHDEVDREVDL